MAARWTKLEAVNEMLESIGETPVSTLQDGVADASRAEEILDRFNRRIQLTGWHANTRLGISLSKDVNDLIAVGDDVLDVDTADPNRKRSVTGAFHSDKHRDVGVRRSSDDTKFILYDLDNDRETWPNLDALTVDVVELIDFENLPPYLQNYILLSAAHRFQKSHMGSRILYEFTREDVEEARTHAINMDAKNSDESILTANPGVYSAVYRHNPLFGS